HSVPVVRLYRWLHAHLMLRRQPQGPAQWITRWLNRCAASAGHQQLGPEYCDQTLSAFHRYSRGTVAMTFHPYGVFGRYSSELFSACTRSCIPSNPVTVPESTGL